MRWFLRQNIMNEAYKNLVERRSVRKYNNKKGES